jgi:Domain of unknown function (DUF4365)
MTFIAETASADHRKGQGEQGCTGGRSFVAAGATPLQDKGKKSRYSLSYLYSICAQGGYTAREVRQDEDVHSIDASVKMRGADVYVQMKCSSSPEPNSSGYRVDFEDGWIQKWREEHLPVYIILVVVPPEHDRWIDHTLATATLHRSAAFWARFDPGSDAMSITVDQRLTVDTMKQWQDDVDDLFAGGPDA